MRWISIAAMSAFSAGLAGCGAGGEESLGLRLYSTLTGGGQEAAPVETPGFTAELIATNPQDFMVVDVPNIGLNQPARRVAANGPEETWAAQGGATFAFDDGILVATRGLIDDLLVISSAGVRDALRAGGGSYSRTIEQLDSLDRLSSEALACTVTADGPESVNLGLREVTLRKFTEICQGQRLAFENAYWLDGAGEIIASRQIVSPGVGYLRGNRL